MKILEAVRETGLPEKDFAALLTIVPETEDQFLSEFSDAAEALFDWKTSRKSQAKLLQMTVVCSPTMNDWVKRSILRAFQFHEAFVDLAAGLEIRVSIMNGGKSPINEFVV